MKKAKKVSPKKTNSIISTDNEMSKLIILILVVALVFALFYVITLFVTKKDTDLPKKTDDDEEVVIQYQNILAGNIFSQKDDEYYVLVYFKNDNNVDLYKSYLSYYKSSVEDAIPYYYVDMADAFNSSFIADKSNLVSDINDLKFSQTAFLRIRDNNIISTYEGNEQITGKLGRMTK